MSKGFTVKPSNMNSSKIDYGVYKIDPVYDVDFSKKNNEPNSIYVNRYLENMSSSSDSLEVYRYIFTNEDGKTVTLITDFINNEIWSFDNSNFLITYKFKENEHYIKVNNMYISLIRSISFIDDKSYINTISNGFVDAFGPDMYGYERADFTDREYKNLEQNALTPEWFDPKTIFTKLSYNEITNILIKVLRNPEIFRNENYVRPLILYNKEKIQILDKQPSKNPEDINKLIKMKEIENYKNHTNNKYQYNEIEEYKKKEEDRMEIRLDRSRKVRESIKL
jgi:hypothetical protein